MIAVIDYGLGNIQAFANVYKNLGIPVKFVKNVDDLYAATHIILPGVGAFDWAMDRLDASGLRASLEYLVLEKRKPILGICVGMQIMAKCSDEGSKLGLGWFDAEVKHFDENHVNSRMLLPHMGWNDVNPVDSNDLFEQLASDARFYFLHSYYFSTNNQSYVLAQTDYFGPFTCAVRHENIYGVQFHPEKSHGWGIQLLRNFARL
jgi:glutamine amidotransferase